MSGPVTGLRTGPSLRTIVIQPVTVMFYLLTSDNQRWQALCCPHGTRGYCAGRKIRDQPGPAPNTRDEVDEIVSAWTKQHPKHEIMRLCGEADITCGGGPDRRRSPQRPPPARTRYPQGYRSSHPPVLSPYSVRPWRFNDQQPPNDTPSPNLGEHNELVYRKLLGLSETEIRTLKEDGVI